MPGFATSVRAIRPRFSLRTFLIAVLMLGAGLGWLASEVLPIRHRQNLLARIQAAGGEVGYEHQGEKGLFQAPPRSRHWLRRFFGDEDFADIKHVLWYSPLPAEADLSVLEELPGLKTLMLSGENVDDKTIARIAQISSLRELHLGRTRVTGDGLTQLGPIQTLVLSGPAVTDATLARIDSLSSIESLTLYDTSVTSSGITSLARLPRLQWLRFLRNKYVDADALTTIGSLGQLRELDFVDTPIGDSRLIELRKLSNLRRLVLHLCGTTDTGLAEIGRLSSLEHLNLIGSKITDAGLAELRALKQLKQLELAGTQVGDAGAAHLRELPSLEWLELSHTQITDAGCEHVGRIRQLKMLDISGTAVTDDGLRKLHTLGRLERLHVSRKATKPGMDWLRAAIEKARRDRGEASSLTIVQF